MSRSASGIAALVLVAMLSGSLAAQVAEQIPEQVPGKVPVPEPGGQPLAAHQGTWRWVPPTRLEDGNIATDLEYFAMYRQAPGGKPEKIVEIHDLAAAHEWRMDTGQAGACFWFVAVRKPGSSSPMPSDRSNVICLDERGQPLPHT